MDRVDINDVRHFWPCSNSTSPSRHTMRFSSKNIALLRRAKNYNTTNALVTMYKALVLPHFTYCSTGWQQGNVTHFDKLHKLQKRAVRIITKSSYEVRSADIFKSLH